VAARNKTNRIEITRVYDAPVEIVWEAWTDPAQVAQWWGPRGFTLTTHSKDLRPGGTWVYTMHGPDGTDYPNYTRYLEVDPRARLVYDHGAKDGDAAPLFRVTVTFTPVDGKARTKMDMTMTLATVEAAEQTRGFIKKAGGESTWDRLAEYLTEQQSGEQRFVIHRSFDAPIARMYELWTDPEHFARWLPPTGFTMKFIRADIRAGGSTRYVMTNGAGTTLHGRASYLELEPPRRIVYTQQICDEHENLARHPGLPTWPATLHTTVTLTEEGPDRTRVQVSWRPEGAVTAEELAAFVEHRRSMTAGWTGSFDKLEELQLEACGR
jgi:uncharacterized protein YndB with AHSA1/START domain